MNNKGFTLIELIVVIVILGILATTAAPKFINLQADARTSTLQGVKAAMQGASALVYGKSVVKGNHKLEGVGGAEPMVTLPDGTELDVEYGFPTSAKADWQKILALNTDDFRMKVNNFGVLIIYPTSIEIPFFATADCIVTYEAATETSKPIFTVNPCK